MVLSFCSVCAALPHNKKHFKPTNFFSITYGNGENICNNVGCKNKIEKSEEETKENNERSEI